MVRPYTRLTVQRDRRWRYSARGYATGAVCFASLLTPIPARRWPSRLRPRGRSGTAEAHRASFSGGHGGSPRTAQPPLSLRKSSGLNSQSPFPEAAIPRLLSRARDLTLTSSYGNGEGLVRPSQDARRRSSGLGGLSGTALRVRDQSALCSESRRHAPIWGRPASPLLYLRVGLCGLAACLGVVGGGSSVYATSFLIRTIAGTGAPGYAGDGGPAAAARLSFPVGVAVDATLNVFIADFGNNTVREINGAGAIRTIAGTGVAGYSGDGGPASSAHLKQPADVTVDSAGNVLIADFGNQRIRKVTPAGLITTFVGPPQLTSPSGLAFDRNGNLFISDFNTNTVLKVTSAGITTRVAGNGTQGYTGDSGSATSAQLNQPAQVAVDSSGNLLIADLGNNRVRKVSTSGIITTLAGSGVAGFSGDGGSATAARLNVPTGVAVDSLGNLFVSDFGNQRIRKVNPSGLIATVAGTGVQGFSGDGGPATSAELNQPARVGLAANGDFYIADAGNARIRVVAALGAPQAPAPTGSTAPAAAQPPPPPPPAATHTPPAPTGSTTPSSTSPASPALPSAQPAAPASLATPADSSSTGTPGHDAVPKSLATGGSGRQPLQASPVGQVQALDWRLGRVVVPVLTKSAFPGLLLLIVLVFLAIQDGIDRREPKLALASVNDDPHLSFTSRSTRHELSTPTPPNATELSVGSPLPSGGRP